MTLSKEQKMARLKDAAKKELLTKKITKLTVSFIKMEADKNMSFVNYGTVAEAQALVQCMRVKLSRMRAELKKVGKRSKSFKMNLQSYTFNELTNETEIVLTKLAPIIPDSELNDILNDLTELGD